MKVLVDEVVSEFLQLLKKFLTKHLVPIWFLEPVPIFKNNFQVVKYLKELKKGSKFGLK